ncbi:hypothetical protein JAAARDRAFT_37727 [Jaapia argillacea MUCL 33604]|uniref:Uncharacterized protein n=1 Tax=Jaapia argillacea MUCL 33604 TaxID=933084 RepID=A0A067PJW2_9AGAM|nr:hypothetical protein JAAARDRAFT_37727 [Jaapia argillacea MUCL 33604]
MSQIALEFGAGNTVRNPNNTPPRHDIHFFSENLSERGIHASYLYILVNLPLIIDPGLMLFWCRVSWVWIRVFLRELKVALAV